MRSLNDAISRDPLLIARNVRFALGARGLQARLGAHTNARNRIPQQRDESRIRTPVCRVSRWSEIERLQGGGLCLKGPEGRADPRRMGERRLFTVAGKSEVADRQEREGH